MRIRTFNILAESEAENYNLKDCPVVIDGYNYFHAIYKDSGLPFVLGGEYDKLAEYVRNHLSMFKKANVTCYFIFKGGIDDVQANMKKHAEKIKAKECDLTQREEIIEPMFTIDVYKQVLKEMGFKYTVCKTEAKTQCIALARDLKCPIISYDIEFCFSNVPYIPSNTLSLNEKNERIECRIFELNKFLVKYSLTLEKLVPFILLRDEKLYPEGTFHEFFRKTRIPLSHYTRNVNLLKWLSKQPTKNNVMDKIFGHLNGNDRCLNSEAAQAFNEKEKVAQSFIDPKIDIGIPAKYLKEEKFEHGTDEARFEYAVASGRIPAPYINLYINNCFKYSQAIEDPDVRDAFFTAIDITKFAFTLLNSEEDDKFLIFNDDGDSHIIIVDREDWDLANRTLTGDFKREEVDEIFRCILKTDMEILLEQLPDESKLLFMSLSYCADRSEQFTDNEVFCVLLSYVMLSPGAWKLTTEDDVAITPGNLPKNKRICDLDISSNDYLVATAMLSKFFELTDLELNEILNRKILHPLVEFQYCLQQLNFLNTLCGQRYKPTVYSKTYNGTFVYKVLYEIKVKHNDNYLEFIESNLKCAPGLADFILDTMGSWQQFRTKNVKSDDNLCSIV